MIEERIKQLKEWDNLYYNKGASPITDEEYDQYREETEKIDPNHKYFKKVGSVVRGAKDRDIIEHKIPMRSLAKAKTIEDVIKWKDNKIKYSGVIVVEPKIDGSSATIKYRDGELIYIATRGNGKEGKDITHIKDYISEIPNYIDIDGEVEIRGELYLKKENSVADINIRNAAAGLINRKEDLEDLNQIYFMAYKLFREDKQYKTEIEMLRELTGLFENTVNFVCVETNIEIEREYDTYIKILRERWNFETDGLVLIVDDRTKWNEINSKYIINRFMHHQIALKPKVQSKKTKLINIEWQISRHGTLIPIAILEPIELLGSIVKKASLSNYKTVLNMKLERGDEVLIYLANDIIPYIEMNLTKKIKQR